MTKNDVDSPTLNDLQTLSLRLGQCRMPEQSGEAYSGVGLITVV